MFSRSPIGTSFGLDYYDNATKLLFTLKKEENNKITKKEWQKLTENVKKNIKTSQKIILLLFNNRTNEEDENIAPLLDIIVNKFPSLEAIEFKPSLSSDLLKKIKVLKNYEQSKEKNSVFNKIPLTLFHFCFRNLFFTPVLFHLIEQYEQDPSLDKAVFIFKNFINDPVISQQNFSSTHMKNVKKSIYTKLLLLHISNQLFKFLCSYGDFLNKIREIINKNFNENTLGEVTNEGVFISLKLNELLLICIQVNSLISDRLFFDKAFCCDKLKFTKNIQNILISSEEIFSKIIAYKNIKLNTKKDHNQKSLDAPYLFLIDLDVILPRKNKEIPDILSKLDQTLENNDPVKKKHFRMLKYLFGDDKKKTIKINSHYHYDNKIQNSSIKKINSLSENNEKKEIEDPSPFRSLCFNLNNKLLFAESIKMIEEVNTKKEEFSQLNLEKTFKKFHDREQERKEKLAQSKYVNLGLYAEMTKEEHEQIYDENFIENEQKTNEENGYASKYINLGLYAEMTVEEQEKIDIKIFNIGKDLWLKEIFALVTKILKFRDLEEALTQHNITKFNHGMSENEFMLAEFNAKELQTLAENVGLKIEESFSLNFI